MDPSVAKSFTAAFAKGDVNQVEVLYAGDAAAQAELRSLASSHFAVAPTCTVESAMWLFRVLRDLDSPVDLQVMVNKIFTVVAADVRLFMECVDGISTPLDHVQILSEIACSSSALDQRVSDFLFEESLKNHRISQLRNGCANIIFRHGASRGLLAIFRSAAKTPTLFSQIDMTTTLFNGCAGGGLLIAKELLKIPNVDFNMGRAISQVSVYARSRHARRAILALLLHDTRCDSRALFSISLPGSMHRIARGDFWVDLAAGEHIEMEDPAGRTLLFYAVRYGTLDLLQEMIAGFRPNPFVCDAAGFDVLDQLVPDDEEVERKAQCLRNYRKISAKTVRQFFPKSLRAKVFAAICCLRRSGIHKELIWNIIAFAYYDVSFPAQPLPLQRLVDLRYPEYQLVEKPSIQSKWTIACGKDIALIKGVSGMLLYDEIIPNCAAVFHMGFNEEPLQRLHIKQSRLFPNRPQEHRFPPSAIDIWEYLFKRHQKHIPMDVLLALLAGCKKNPGVSPLALISESLLIRIVSEYCWTFWPGILSPTSGRFWILNDDSSLVSIWEEDTVYFIDSKLKICYRLPRGHFFEGYRKTLMNAPIRKAALLENSVREVIHGCFDTELML